MNINFKIIGLTRLGIKPKSTAPEADAVTTRPSELLMPAKPTSLFLSSLLETKKQTRLCKGPFTRAITVARLQFFEDIFEFVSRFHTSDCSRAT